MDTSHLVALQEHLDREKARYAKDGRPLRAVWIAQTEKEISCEMKFLGLDGELPEMTDDEILAELLGD